MILPRWIAPILTLSAVFWLTGAYGKGNAEMAQQEDVRFRMGIYESYILLRDGVEPITDIKARGQIVQNVSDSSHAVLAKNKSLNTPSQNDGCKRFLNLYQTVTNQLESNLIKYLRQPDLSPETRVYLMARLETLNMFETSLFSLVLFNAEAGYSDLDPGARRTCDIADRRSWQNTMLRAHQNATAAHLAFFGQKSVSDPVTAHSSLSEFNRRYSTRQTEKKIGFIGAELLASIIVWEKAVQPWLGPLGRTAKVLVNSAYIISLVTVDRYARQHVSFLKEPVAISNGQALASWESLMSFGEQFTAADEESPALYAAYLQLIESTERQRALDFLTENEWMLVDAEAKHGSVDAALKILKEESTL